MSPKLVLASLLITLLASHAIAQPTSAPVGLDSLNDDRLMNELAARGLGTLLDRAFEVNRIPQSEQESRRAVLALQALSDPTKKLSPKDRQELLSKFAAGIEQALPRLRDPQALLSQAKVLIDQGVNRDVNTLEYWGENLTVMSQLRPVAQAVGKMFDRAAQLAAEQVNAISSQITNPNNTQQYAKLEQADQLQNIATYSARMNDYAIALSIDSADPQRKTIADTAIQYLQTLDSEDQPVRAMVHVRIAKLNMVKGDYAAARQLFDDMLKADFKPAPATAQLYEARYFRAVTDVLDKKPDDAKKAMATLIAWQQANLPKDAATQSGAAAAAAMLEYRIASLQADLASTTTGKTEANANARKVLLKLQADHPEFRSIISDLIIARLPENASMTELDPLMLDALVRRGVVEAQRPETEQADAKTLTRAAAAASEIVKRKGQGTEAQSLENAEFVLGYFHERLGNAIEAINAFLDYVEHHPQTERAPIAMQKTESGIIKSKKALVEDARISSAYDRFLPLAIGSPYNRKALALEYARRLQLQDKPKEALKYFEQVPPDDKRMLAARFYQMIATKQVLDALPANDPQRRDLLASIQKLADDVTRLAGAAIASAKDEKERQSAQSMIVRTKLLAAEVARVDQKDPARALTLLADFEQAAKGLPNEANLTSEALLIRVQGLMSQGKYNDASQTLVTLLKTREGGQGAAIVYSLLLKLDADYDKAAQAGDRTAMQTLARNRASLSGFLVEWAKNNSDPRIKKFTYRYSVYEADTKHRAAEVEDDPAHRKALFDQALKLYQNLESPENLTAYRDTLAPPQRSTDAHDPAVERGLAMVQYDLGNFADAQSRLAVLLKDGRLGSPLLDVEQDGQLRTVDNNAYWEAVLKLIKSNIKLGADLEAQKTFLKGLYVRWGDRVGGMKWKKEFATLKSELIPDFVVPGLDSATTQPG